MKRIISKKGIATRVIAILLLVLTNVMSASAIELSDDVKAEISRIEEGDIDALIEYLNTQIPHLLNQNNVPGLSVAIVHQGETYWAQGYGYANKAQQQSVETDTIFQVGSISKSLAALGVMKLVEQGRIELDVPVENYLQSWKLPESKYDKKEVTIRRLLNHTAGLSVGGYSGFHPEDTLPSTVESLNGELGSHSFMTWLYNYFPSRLSVHLIEEPGAETIYSGGGYTVLQLVIEEISGKIFSEYMKTEILQPADMVASGFEWQDIDQSKLAVAYDGNDASPNFLYTAKAAAGLYTTSTDLAKFIQVLTKQPSLISKHTLIQMQEHRLGMWRTRLSDKISSFGHGGSNSGDWRAGYQFLENQPEGIVVLTNGSKGRDVWHSVIKMWQMWVVKEY